MNQFLRWFSGGDHQYIDYWNAMRGDIFWIYFTIVVCSLVFVGDCIIAIHIHRNAKNVTKGLLRNSMRNIANVFIFSGICGYVSIIFKIWWPAWRLFDILYVGLVYYLWRYAFDTPKLSLVYEQLHDQNAVEEKNIKDQIGMTVVEMQKPIRKLKDRVLLTIDEADVVTPALKKALFHLNEAEKNLESLDAIKGKVENTKG